MKITFLALLGIALTASATPLHWYSALDHFNLTSDERPMDSNFRFELGVFSDGFVPTAENRDEWSAYWVPAQRATYHAANHWYSGFLVVDDNEYPFEAGADAWVWGFSGDASGGDWILYRSSNWRWPQANSRLPVVRHWDAKNADTVLIGSVGQEQDHLLKAAAVEGAIPPTTTFEQWAVERGGSFDEQNLVEFATGGKADPVSFNRIPAAGGSSKIEIILTHLADRQLSGVGLEVSEDLQVWRSFHAYAELIETTPTQLIFEVDAEAANSPNLFFRARYER